jgi:hypothetical protein
VYGLGLHRELVASRGKKESNADKKGMHAKHADGPTWFTGHRPRIGSPGMSCEIKLQAAPQAGCFKVIPTTLKFDPSGKRRAFVTTLASLVRLRQSRIFTEGQGRSKSPLRRQGRMWRFARSGFHVRASRLNHDACMKRLNPDSRERLNPVLRAKRHIWPCLLSVLFDLPCPSVNILSGRTIHERWATHPPPKQHSSYPSNANAKRQAVFTQPFAICVFCVHRLPAFALKFLFPNATGRWSWKC